MDNFQVFIWINLTMFVYLQITFGDAKIFCINDFMIMYLPD